jgi:short-subunit dehydrogenase involved in D-alanine esterification of teichoic acids
MGANKQVVIVTGAASGIGFGIAKEFVKSGNTVAIFDMNLEQAKKASALLKIKFTTEADVARTILFFANFPGLGMTGQSMLVTHNWLMEA